VHIFLERFPLVRWLLAILAVFAFSAEVTTDDWPDALELSYLMPEGGGGEAGRAGLGFY
jgi:hypothetical protein